ncbi:hypothetical protein H5410_026833 [Solanum commersonii]|uniref:SWIM-type domain-containing protein n=1 Tax=Solanum commersonii TaxID=4109 RepID=A0A9J5YZN1_SOLCO|nr:hypothetical protein H5410_026833 [Solanum commersonii]
MDTIIITRFHHGGKFIQDKNKITYKRENEVEYFNIDKDHFSIIELLFYTKQLRYITIGGFCVKDLTKNDFVEVETDFTLLNLIKDLKDGDFLYIYVKHVVDDVEVVTTTGLLCGLVVEKNSNVVGKEDLQDMNVTASEGLNYEAESENVNVEIEPRDISDLEEEWAGSNQESSADSQEDAIPDEDDSEVDEELRSLRNERRNKVKKKKPIQTKEIKLGTAGIDRGFEEIGRNKGARYIGRLGGLVPALCELLPDSEQRRCARHILSNWHQIWSGEERKNQFRRCAKPSFEVKFEDEMNKLNKLDISPMARLVLEENKDVARFCEVRFYCDIGYEILDGQYMHIVDIRKKTCTCRTWQLRGILCQHVVLAYQHKGIEPEHEVVHWFRKETFLKVYNHFLQSIPNMKMWPHTSGVVIEPHEPKVMPGRPLKCRRKAKNEPRKKYGKLSKREVKMTCSLCHQAVMGQPGGYPSMQPSSSQPPVFSQPSSSSHPSVINQPSSSSKPPLFRQPSSSGQPPLFSRPSSSSQPPPGTSGERVITPGVYKDATPINIDIGYKPRGLKWNGGDVVTALQLQCIKLISPIDSENV